MILWNGNRLKHSALELIGAYNRISQNMISTRWISYIIILVFPLKYKFEVFGL